ncbi:uncharacterized protein LOC130613559 [Hydractinia symbiolongicarpus]|uniref:uncharacterized protein LOC130613559 n=1 Tax=Hydractinia symbiolongicarpus TaxID=13093 RepID=UPI00254CEC2D|nr:uncharacterized protein LOC130613559 [Hydractinia symbiolongicarpus]
MQDIFPVYNPNYNLRNNREFTGRNAKSVYYGAETLSFIGYNIWQQIPVFSRSYLTNRFQRVGIDGYFSLWKEIISCVPQGSILGPLLFNININDLMFILNDRADVKICNYADDNTLYTYGKQFEEIKLCLESAFSTVSTWFFNNGLQLNSEKQHVLPLCKKANAKINALKRISPYMSNYKRNVIANSFIYSIFNYWLLIWGFSTFRNFKQKVKVRSRTKNLTCDIIAVHHKNHAVFIDAY